MAHIKYLLIGTYTSGESKGIQLYAFDEENGDFRFIQEIEIENPSYLTVSPDGKYIYAVSENEKNPCYLNAFRFDPENERIVLLNRKETYGAAPCNVEVDNTGKYVVTANYAGGSISVFSINYDGELSDIIQRVDFEGSGVNALRQEAPHLHSVKFSPEGKYLFAADLGTDYVYRIEVNRDGGTYLDEKSIQFFQVPAGSGPRHLLFHPSGKYLYLIAELKGEVVVFQYEENLFQGIQSEIIDQVDGNEAGDIAITPDGRFLYASSRTVNDGVAVFSIDQETGEIQKLSYLTTGIHPRNISITPNGKYLLVANKDSHSIEIYEIDKNTGLLNKTDKDIKVNQPVCVEFI